jgi:Zn finger protein HypA/HybF involved in hydrogenase expression
MATEPAERRKVYLKRKKTGLCPRCGQKVKKSSKFKMCDDCREYFRNYNREISDSVQAARRERYEQRKAKNCCPRCGIFLGKRSKNTICPKCLKKQYKYNYGKTKPKKR